MMVLVINNVEHYWYYRNWNILRISETARHLACNPLTGDINSVWSDTILLWPGSKIVQDNSLTVYHLYFLVESTHDLRRHCCSDLIMIYSEVFRVLLWAECICYTRDCSSFPILAWNILWQSLYLLEGMLCVLALLVSLTIHKQNKRVMLEPRAQRSITAIRM
jgi:hypothetical protein